MVRETADNRCCHLFAVPPTFLSAWVLKDAAALLRVFDLHYRDMQLYTHTRLIHSETLHPFMSD